MSPFYYILTESITKQAPSLSQIETFKHVKKALLRPTLTALLLAIMATAGARTLSPKHEMRAAWIASVENIDWPSAKGLTPDQQRQEFIKLVDRLKNVGINAVIVQIRPCADALYDSKVEPWSMYLTGKQGVAPSPYYDPLKFMIEECHKRCIEFHAWFNPYRTIKDTSYSNIDSTHIIKQHPEWLVTYGNQRYFDPGLPQTRNHVLKVIMDVVTRYDIDGVHFDDYFYPYKIKGVDFPDSTSFATYPRGFTSDQKEMWRRDNVNLIIRMLHDSIRAAKPYVKFGISPFGIWRNKASDPRGSETNGGSNYDELYADILLWMQNRWIDYVVPQLYWHIGLKVADYKTLAEWWSKNSNGIPLYIGQGYYRVDPNSKTKEWADGKEISRQLALNRTIPEIGGSIFFSAKSFLNDNLNVNEQLKTQFYQYPALIPQMNFIDSLPPTSPTHLSVKNRKEGAKLNWSVSDTTASELDKTRYFVVYRFKDKIDYSNPANIYTITRDTSIILKKEKGKRRYSFSVTALDRLYNESKPTKAIKVRL